MSKFEECPFCFHQLGIGDLKANNICCQYCDKNGKLPSNFTNIRTKSKLNTVNKNIDLIYDVEGVDDVERMKVVFDLRQARQRPKKIVNKI